MGGEGVGEGQKSPFGHHQARTLEASVARDMASYFVQMDLNRLALPRGWQHPGPR